MTPIAPVGEDRRAAEVMLREELYGVSQGGFAINRKHGATHDVSDDGHCWNLVGELRSVNRLARSERHIGNSPSLLGVS